ncbi:MAG: hypothetical protein ACMVP2_22175 [Imperialibacter sp.]|uniref:hypothetical protein n=1 Tax=Imperialibacter sp. TaxID=2038411 RepID=UPI003A87BA4A
MAAQIKQFSKRLSGTCLLALSVLMAIIGLYGLDSISHKGLPGAPKTELVSHTSATRYHSYKQAVADYHQSFLRSNCGKINFLALSRLESVASKRQYNLSISRFLEVRANQLSRERFQFYFTYSQEAITHS